jgi:hypothetical protein
MFEFCSAKLPINLPNGHIFQNVFLQNSRREHNLKYPPQGLGINRHIDEVLADSAKLAPLEQKTERTRAKKSLTGNRTRGHTGHRLAAGIESGRPRNCLRCLVCSLWSSVYIPEEIFAPCSSALKSLLPAWDATFTRTKTLSVEWAAFLKTLKLETA